MSELPYATEKRSSYENFIARCPWCGFENIFNRASDLKDLSVIVAKEVTCLNKDCKGPFKINGDSANSAYEMLIYDCYELRQRKQYAYCILNLAQALEIFFSLYLRIELLYRPFAVDTNQNIDRLNRLAAILYDKVKRHAFNGMRNLFLRQVFGGIPLRSLDEAEATINALPDKPSEPPDRDIQSLADQKLSTLLMRLKDCSIGELRNRVVHQRAYRPTSDEVDGALREIREIVFPLARTLRMDGDDINWYLGSV